MAQPLAFNTTECERTLEDIIKEVERSVHIMISETQSFLLTEVIQIPYLGHWSG
jgi:hypothetical protein